MIYNVLVLYFIGYVIGPIKYIWLFERFYYNFIKQTKKPYFMTFNTDAKILGKIASTQSKIQRLEALRSLTPFEQVTFFFYGSGGKFLSINENDIPFDLAFEIRILIDAAIDHYNIEIKTLENSFQ